MHAVVERERDLEALFAGDFLYVLDGVEREVDGLQGALLLFLGGVVVVQGDLVQVPVVIVQVEGGSAQ